MFDQPLSTNQRLQNGALAGIPSLDNPMPESIKYLHELIHKFIKSEDELFVYKVTVINQKLERDGGG